MYVSMNKKFEIVLNLYYLDKYVLVYICIYRDLL